MMKPMLFRLGVLACCFWAGLTPGHAADYYVRPPGTTATVESPYNSWVKAATNIQLAVDVAMANLPATVWVTNGAYCVTSEVTITNSITLKSINGWTNTLVYADWPAYVTRCFYVTNAGVVYGFAISNGHTTGVGGGAVMVSSSRFENCYFTHNVADSYGGGAYMSDSTVFNCRFMTNVSKGVTYAGGGIYAAGASIIDRCIIIGNTILDPQTGKGGGVQGGYIYNSIIISNYAMGYQASGGGIAFPIKVTNCLIAFNSADRFGGGIYCNWAGGVVIEGCVISNNYLGFRDNEYRGGAGIYAADGAGSMTIANCVIVENRYTAANPGYASYGGGLSVNSAAYVSNCVIAGNTGVGGGGVWARDTAFYFCQVSNNLNTGSSGGAGIGGGGMALNNNCPLRNCVIVNNTNLATNSFGGGVYMIASGANSYMESCTLAGNFSTNDGGGLCTTGTVKYVVNSIIHVNRSHSNNYPDIYNMDAANALKFTNSCSSYTALPAGQGNITGNPDFKGNGDWRLRMSSPCINTGTNQAWMTNTVDLAGVSRILYGIVDMGAYETPIVVGTVYRILGNAPE